MLNEAINDYLNPPGLTQTEQGINTYPRVIRQEPRGDTHMLVTFALPGLRRAKMLVPLTEWIASNHLDTHDAQMRHLARIAPTRKPQPDDWLIGDD